MEFRIPIYNKEENKLQFYNLQHCYESAVIDTNYELIGEDDFSRIGLQTLLNGKYVVRDEDLNDLIVYLDKTIGGAPRDVEKWKCVSCKKEIDHVLSHIFDFEGKDFEVMVDINWSGDKDHAPFITVDNHNTIIEHIDNESYNEALEQIQCPECKKQPFKAISDRFINNDVVFEV